MIYIAAPFFNEKQVQTIEKIKNVLGQHDVTYFSPKDRLEILEGKKSSLIQRKVVFEGNCNAIDSSVLIIAIIDDFDKGVLWEVGYGYARNKKILFYTDFEDRGLNIMLELSGIGMIHGEKELEEWIQAYHKNLL